MKKIFTIFLYSMFLTAGTTSAQNCDFGQSGVRFNYSSYDPTTGICTINIDLYFDLRTNSGSKYVTLHIWPTGSYPNLSYTNPPVLAQLTTASTIVIHHFQDHTLSHIDTVYKPDIGVEPQYSDMYFTIKPSEQTEYDRFTITNINLEVAAGCDIPQSFIVDAWSTEAESMNAVHCVDKGNVFYANNPRVIGLLNCNLPRTYNVQLFSIDPNPMTVSYKVYIDDGDNVFNRILDTLMIKTETGIIISQASSYNSGFFTYLPYSNLAPWANMNLWVEVTSASLPNSVIAAIENSCSALPVNLKSFDVTKVENGVFLEWVTASEFGNTGFYIERKIGNGQWETIDFVTSLADKGTSTHDILYSYTDPVTVRAIIQYRLRQTDVNGNFDYSAIRVVKGEAVADIVIFPNPAAGSVNILFGNSVRVHDLRLYTADGKLVRQWRDIGPVLTINSLGKGLYFIKILEGENSVPRTCKLIVQ